MEIETVGISGVVPNGDVDTSVNDNKDRIMMFTGDTVLATIFNIVNPLCQSVNINCERLKCSSDNSDFLKIYNPLSDKYFKFFPTLQLIICIENETLFLRLYLQQKKLFKESCIVNIKEQLSNPEEYFGIVSVLSDFLSELSASKYEVCPGAFDECSFDGDISSVELKSVFIEHVEAKIIYRSRQCHMLTKDGNDVKCKSCIELLQSLKPHGCEDMETSLKDYSDLKNNVQQKDPLDVVNGYLEFSMEESNKTLDELQQPSDTPYKADQIQEFHSKKVGRGSYKMLIYSALQDSPRKMMKLTEIYEWILERYPSFRANKNGFQNSIRHNLSLNKMFIKVDSLRPGNYGGEAGRGGYWTIDPNHVRRQENRYNPIKQKASLLRTSGCVEPEASPSPTSISAPAFHSLSQLSALDQITVNIKTEQEVKPPMPACSVPPSYTHSSPKRWTTNRVCDDTTTPASAEYSKPTFSYKELIMVAIVSDPTGAICLNDIYNNIRRFFPYFQQKTIGLTWQNSIRHNLSLNKCFRRLDNNGSGTPTKVRLTLDSSSK